MLDFLAAVGSAIWGVWTLDRSLGEWFGPYPLSLWVSFAIAMLAGASTLLGNSVVLFLNRVRGTRFVVSLLLNGLSMVGLYIAQAAVIAGVGYLVTGERLTLVLAAKAVMLATAPMIFGFFSLMPYLGPGVARLLQAWGLVALWVIVGVLYGVNRWTALLITGAGWATMQGASWLLARPLTKVANAIWYRISGHRTMLTGEDLLSGHQFMPVEFTLDLSDEPEALP
ncbi:MAG TPA: hypothetical protein PLE12_09895 [Propionicimonas sp.]|nr:hypothetical protein [Propionicimonas sp.]